MSGGGATSITSTTSATGFSKSLVGAARTAPERQLSILEVEPKLDSSKTVSINRHSPENVKVVSFRTGVYR